ncbi:Gfo/Idh/MocA family oxidoreductase [uncultured Draconibacterium sp.]|uniref:Gfo/Idh/MocA family protein n=1 Tax=uncultured Draconibacterium sp. TaxID=1573823 RepID=UPI0025D1599E|nr:Gfo/Idh/MocA family oxidoreductase [uncultured Draconibacterium sp.]
MNQQKTIKWGIIGVGNVTEVKSGPAFYKINNSKLVAVMRRSEDKVKDYALRHRVPRWYTDGSALINDPDVDAVYIATPPDTHASYAIEALKAGKPVYVEKPMARNFNECLEMIQTAEQVKLPIWVAYYRRALPAFLKVKELLENEQIGKPYAVNVKLYKEAEERNQKPDEMHWHVFPEISGGGHFFDLASHQFDYLDFIFGKITTVFGQAVNRAGLYPAEDTVSASWKHESGVLGSGSWCFAADKNSVEDSIQIIGEKGEICLSCFSHGEVLLKNKDGAKKLNFNNPEHISQNLVEQVVNELLGSGRCVSTGKSATRTSWVLDEIVKSYYAEKKKE